MIMVTGGAFQGKTDWALKNLGIQAGDMLDGKSCGPEEIFAAKCVRNYQELIRRLEVQNVDPYLFTQRFCLVNKSAVVIMDEVGCGIVPAERSLRIWREDCGRCGTVIASNCKTVYRICCGIASVIKHT